MSVLINKNDQTYTLYTNSSMYQMKVDGKGIGMIWEDIEEYKTKPGLVDGFEHLSRGGEKIYNIHELLLFIKDISEGKDNSARVRQEVMRDVHGENKICTPSVVDFIIEKAGL